MKKVLKTSDTIELQHSSIRNPYFDIKQNNYYNMRFLYYNTIIFPVSALSFVWIPTSFQNYQFNLPI